MGGVGRARGHGIATVLALALAVALAQGACRFDVRSRADVFSAALAFQRAGDTALAVALWHEVLAAHPDDAAAWRHLAECEETLGHADDATAAWRRTVELRPDWRREAETHLVRLGVDPAALLNRPAGPTDAGSASPGTADLTAPPGPPPLGGKHVDPHLMGVEAPRGTYYPGGGAAPGGVLGTVLPTRLERTAVGWARAPGAGGAGGSWALAMDVRGERVAHALPGGGIRLAEFGKPSPALVVDERRGGAALSVALSVAPFRIAWAALDGKVRVRGPRGEAVATLDAGSAAVRGVAIDPDAQRVHAASDDATMRTWMLAPEGASSPRLERVSKLPSRPTALALSPGSRWLAVALEDGHVLLVDPMTGRLEASLREHVGRATGVAFTADGRHLVTGGWDGTARIYHTGTWEPVGAHPLHPDVITAVAAGARVAVTASADCRLKVIDAHGGIELLQLPGHTAEVEGVAVSADGRRLASIDWSGEVRFWELR